MFRVAFVLLLMTCFCAFRLGAQANYVLVERGDVTVFDEIPVFAPDARIGGKFDLYFNALRGPNLQGSPAEDEQRFFQNFSLDFTSEVSRKIAMNFSITNEALYRSSSGVGFYPLSPVEREAIPVSLADFEQVIFDVANIDFQYTPNWHLVAGFQEIGFGDGKGLIYEGNNLALSSTCGLGTWCFKFGFAQINPDTSDLISWAELLYPVFDNGVRHPDLWNPGEERKDSYFEVGIYQASYGDTLLPLSRYGGFTWDATEATADVQGLTNAFQLFHTDESALYYSPTYSYYGINFVASHLNFNVEMDFIALDGRREFFSGRAGVGEESLGSNAVNGRLVNLEVGYLFADQYKAGVQYLSASGTNGEDVSGDGWNFDSLSYYEIHKGTYGDANIFFDGKQETGQGHGVSNLTFSRLFFSFRSTGGTYGLDLDVYRFERTEPVRDATGDEVKLIGTEVNLGFSYLFEKNFRAKLELSAFETGDAYVENDNQVPAEARPESFSFITASLHYKF